MQSRINKGPKNSIDYTLYNSILNFDDGWTKRDNYDDIPAGDQVRYIMYDDVDDVNKFRSGGFMILDDNEYFVLKGYNYQNYSVQKATVVELWHRHLVRKGRPVGSKSKNKFTLYKKKKTS